MYEQERQAELSQRSLEAGYKSNQGRALAQRLSLIEMWSFIRWFFKAPIQDGDPC